MSPKTEYNYTIVFCTAIKTNKNEPFSYTHGVPDVLVSKVNDLLVLGPLALTLLNGFLCNTVQGLRYTLIYIDN